MQSTPHSSGNPRLFVLGLLVVLFGAWSFAAGLSEGAARLFLLYGSWGAIPPELSDAGRFAFVVLGGVLVGWGVTLAAMASAWEPGRSALLRRALLLGVGTWFVVDSVGSLLTGALPNAVQNLAFVAIGVWAAREK